MGWEAGWGRVRAGKGNPRGETPLLDAGMWGRSAMSTCVCRLAWPECSREAAWEERKVSSSG